MPRNTGLVEVGGDGIAVVLEDQAGAGGRHTVPGGQVVDNEAPHRRRILDSDVDQEVVSPAEKEDLDHLGDASHLLRESTDALLARTGTQGHSDDGLEPSPQGTLVEGCVKARDHAAVYESANAGVRG